jgi:hypothetical protein
MDIERIAIHDVAIYDFYEYVLPMKPPSNEPKNVGTKS